MKNITWILITLLISFVMYGCDKEADQKPGAIIEPTEAPVEMNVVKGNNQVGFRGDLLPDSIFVEIVPDKMDDIDHYSYSLSHWGANVVETKRMADRVLVKILWSLNLETDQRTTLFLYSDLNKNKDGTNDPIASVDIYATSRSLWDKVFTATGSLKDMHFSDPLNGIVIGEYADGNAKTIDGGKTWSIVRWERNDLYQFSFYDSLNGIVIVTSNWAYFTNDGGNTYYEKEWTPPIVGHLSSNDYLMLDENTILTIGGNGTIVKSVDSGKTWKKYKGFHFYNSLLSITSVNKHTYFACGQVGKIVRTTNGGDSWTETDLLINNDLNTIYFINEQVGFAGGTYGMLVRTTNGGDRWTILNPGLKFPIINIHFFNNEMGYVVTSAGEIAKTTDGGESWELISKENYGVYDLAKAYFIDSKTLLGLQGNSIFKYEL